MVTPDPRRGDEPGDPNITPGSPRPDGGSGDGRDGDPQAPDPQAPEPQDR